MTLLYIFFFNKTTVSFILKILLTHPRFKIVEKPKPPKANNEQCKAGKQKLQNNEEIHRILPRGTPIFLVTYSSVRFW